MEAFEAERLTPRTADLEFKPRPSLYVVSLDKELYSTLPRFTQVYKWVPAKYCWEVTLRWASIPSGGGGQVAMHLGMPHAKETFSRVARPSPLYLTD